jgi:hypothetical protein
VLDSYQLAIGAFRDPSDGTYYPLGGFPNHDNLLEEWENLVEKAKAVIVESGRPYAFQIRWDPVIDKDGNEYQDWYEFVEDRTGLHAISNYELGEEENRRAGEVIENIRYALVLEGFDPGDDIHLQRALEPLETYIYDHVELFDLNWKAPQ